MNATDWTVVVLTGGTSRRMGRDKATLEVAGATLLERTLAKVPSDVAVVVAGPVVPLARPGVTFVQEDPPGGGPVAGIAASLALVTTPVVVVLATDLPLVGALPQQLVLALLDEDDEAPPLDAIVTDDASGRCQPLCAAYRVDALQRAIGPDPHGASAHSVVDRLRVAGLSILVATDDPQLVGMGPTWDVDTPEDLQRLRDLLDERDDGDTP